MRAPNLPASSLLSRTSNPCTTSAAAAPAPPAPPPVAGVATSSDLCRRLRAPDCGVESGPRADELPGVVAVHVVPVAGVAAAARAGAGVPRGGGAGLGVAAAAEGVAGAARFLAPCGGAERDAPCADMRVHGS